MFDQSVCESIPLSFYQRDEVVKISQELTGTVFLSIGGGFTNGWIIGIKTYIGRKNTASLVSLMC